MATLSSSSRTMVVASVFTVALCLHCVSCEMFTALADLKNVLYAESNLAQDLKNYIYQEEQRLDALRKLADDYESHSSFALESEDPEAQLANPIQSFLLVKRFTADWNAHVNDYIRVNTSEEFLETIRSRTHFFPSDEDLHGAATALFRLQDTYALTTEQLASGQIKGVQYSPQLSVDDIFELGRIAYGKEDYYHCILWMDYALQLYDYAENVVLSKPSLLDYLAYAVYKQGNIKEAMALTEDWLEIEPDHIRAQNNMMYYREMFGEESKEQRKGDTDEADMDQPEFKNERPLDDYRKSDEFATYEALCRGEDTHENPVFSQLTCQYRRHQPRFYIDPLKEETMFLDPRIVIYHDVMTDTEIAKVKELATPKLNRATAFNKKTGKYESAEYRISKSAWLRDDSDILVNRISQRTAGFTNLTLDTVEELQVVNYGIGGHYEPHYDFARPKKKKVPTATLR